MPRFAPYHPTPRSRPSRRGRRGLSALAGTVFLTLVASVGFVMWSGAEATRLRDARAAMAADWIAGEGRALHFWLHEAQKAPAFGLPSVGRARALTSAERTSLKTHPMRPAWLDPPSTDQGITYLIARPEGAELAHGIVVLTPGPDAPEPIRRLSDHICLRLERAAPGTMAGAERLAAQVTGGLGVHGCDRDGAVRSVAAFAWPHAGIRTDFVLREKRAGWRVLPMATALDMGEHAITGAGVVNSETTAPPANGTVTIRRESGTLAVSGGLATEAALTPPADGDVTVGAAITAAQLQLTDTLTGESTLNGDRIGTTGLLKAKHLTVTRECLGC